MTTFDKLQEHRSGARRAPWRAWRAFGAAVAVTEFGLIVALSVACGVAYHLVVYGHGGDALVFASLGAVVGFMFVTTNAFRGDYDIRAYFAASGRIKHPVASWSLAFLYTGALSFVAKAVADLSRGNVLVLYGVGLAALLLWRHALIRAVVYAGKTGRIAVRRVVLIGEKQAIRDFARRYQPWNLGFEIVGEAVLASPASMHRDLDRAAYLGRTLEPDDIFVLLPWFQTDAIERVLDRLLTLPVSIHLGPEQVLDRFRTVQIVKASTMATLCLVRPPLSGLEIVSKRLFDVAAALLGLLLLLPLFVAVAALIKLDSRGPVFFRQQRYGFNQRPFAIYKFRTMTVQQDGDSVPQATRGDPRITRAGRFLRRWNIDELPQLFNVLLGHMSLVGPRPHAVPHNREYERRIALYARRHNVKPGITGWAQVNGLRGETDTDDKMRRRVEFDLFYIDNWSLAFDLRILGLTLFSPKAYRNAY
jgi:Undecaprenyl-phosphate glucose phosphotransferase